MIHSVRGSLAVAALVVSLAGAAMGQGTFTMRFYAYNSVTPIADSSLLRLGRDPRGTYCVDPFTFFDQGLGFPEFELPPLPPGFDARSVRIPSRPGTGGCTGTADRTQGMSNDIRGVTSRTQIDTFQVNFQVGDVGPMHFSWPAGLGVFCDSITLRTFGGAVVETANMLTTQSFTPTDLDAFAVRIFMYGAPTATLVSPANGSNVPPGVTLIWNALAGATRYHLQVATDSLFTGLIVNDSTLTGVSRIMTGLGVPVTYYWRVSAGNVLGFSAYSPFRRFTTASVPAAPALLSPANGATGQSSSLTLRWNSSPSAQTYQAQISTDSNFVSLFLNDSTITDTTRGVVGLSFSTKYYWRVRGRNGVGPGTYSTTFNFTTQFQPPPAPTLVSPANGQTSVPISPTLTWNAVGGAISYRIQVATNAGFTNIVLDDSTVTTTSRSLGPLLNNTQYFWHVNAKNPGGSGPYSSTFSFVTIVSAPPAPTLVSPPNGAVNVSLLPTLIWNAAPTASSYRLQVARDSLFGLIVVDDSSIAGTSRQISQLISNTIYYWRVRGKNVGGIGPFSSMFQFTTTQAPPPPTQVLPLDSATRVSRTPTFVWTAVNGATSYTLQIGTEPTFGTLIVNDSTITETTRTVGPLPYASILHWRVRARNSSGPSEFTPSRVFTVMLEPPGVPAHVSPANNAINVPLVVPLRWTNTPLASGYHLQVAFDTLMTNLVLNDTTIIDTIKTINVFPSMAHYWRIRAHNTQHNYGPFSPSRRFTSGNFPPPIPTPVYPANGDTGITRNPTFTWVSSPGASSYRIQVATNITFTQMLADDSTVTTNSFYAGVLPSRVSCFWRVRAKGTAGSSNYCQVQAFTTGTFTPVEEEPRIPTALLLRQNYPNPFNPTTSIPFEIPGAAFVTVKVYDLLGREIQSLLSEELPIGAYTVRWNGQNHYGESVPSGMYLVRLVAADASRTIVTSRKIMLLK